MVTLGGHMMVCRGNKLDYCWLEAIESVLPVVDEFALVLFSDDDLESFKASYLSKESKINVQKLNESDFDNRTDKQLRLNHFTNVAREMLTTEWQFQIQADEVLHEDCYFTIRELMKNPKHEAYAVQRRSTWGDPYHYINYPKLYAEGRGGELPCSEYVVRLAKTKYLSYGDAESLDAPFTWDYKDAIRLYHAGFVREPKKKTEHILHIQEKVFDLGYHDPRTDADIKENGGAFRPYTRFSRFDLLPCMEAPPKVLKKWIAERHHV